MRTYFVVIKFVSIRDGYGCQRRRSAVNVSMLGASMERSFGVILSEIVDLPRPSYQPYFKGFRGTVPWRVKPSRIIGLFGSWFL